MPLKFTPLRVRLRLRLDIHKQSTSVGCIGVCDRMHEDSANHSGVWDEPKVASTNFRDLMEEGRVKGITETKGIDGKFGQLG